MKDKSILKKVGLIAILVVIVIAIAFVIINSSSGKKEEKASTKNASVSKVSQSENTSEENIVENTTEDSVVVEEKEIKTATVTELEDGTKYSVTDEEITPEIVIGDNYFGTQLADINMNFDQYEGKTIEIEGLYFENMDYTFVGRYSTSNVCPTCPTGYSYFEYEWHGDKKLPVADSENWLKVVGTLEKGYDGVEYYYIDVANVEIMNEKGIDTVSN